MKNFYKVTVSVKGFKPQNGVLIKPNGVDFIIMENGTSGEPRDKQNIEKNWLGDYQGTAEKRAFIKLIIMETKIDRWGRNQFNKESIEVINFQAFLLKHKNDAKRILNISVNDNENSRIILVRNFLKLIGIKLICKKNALDVRQYSVDLL